jgi:hypothetical protein
MVEISDRVWKAVRPDPDEAEVAKDAETVAEIIELDDAFSEEDELPIAVDD